MWVSIYPWVAVISSPRWEKRGSISRWRKGTGSQSSGTETHQEQDASPHSSLLSSSVPSSLSWFQVKMTLGLGLFFFLKIKMGEEKGTLQARRDTPLDSRNLRWPEILVLSTGKSSLWKFQCGQISSIAASLPASHSLKGGRVKV